VNKKSTLSLVLADSFRPESRFLKVVLGIPWFLPTAMGGTEVYVSGLAEELRMMGIECVIAAPSADGKAKTSKYRNTRIFHYPGPWEDAPTRSVLDCSNADLFRDWLSSERPDVYHQHDWSPNCGLAHLRAAKGLGIPTFITVHLAKLVCITRLMIWEGVSQCDGEIIEQRCARCFMKSRGIPASLAASLALMPSTVSANFEAVPVIGRVLAGGLRAKRALAGIGQVAETVDGVVTVCDWLRSALLINGVPQKKITFVRSGVDPEIAAVGAPPRRHSDDVLRIGFIGRWLEPKGLHVLIEALEQLPKEIRFHLKVIGVAGTDKVDMAYRDKIEKLVAGNSKYEFVSNQPRAAMNEFYQSIDVLAVPSQLLETGPLVVLEANALKVPVIGSDLGGIRELVRHEENGLLVPHDDVGAWAGALRRLAQDPALLQRFREKIGPVRTMRDTAREMANLYGQQVDYRANLLTTSG
jgi:glycosyltransferase involved in cell wall biosynthesis